MSSGNRILILVVLVAGLAGGVALERFLLAGNASREAVMDRAHAVQHLDPAYVCPMHADIVADAPGSCPICGMALVERVAPAADDAGAGDHPVVSIAPDVINNLGVKTVPVRRGTLVRKIETPGFIQQIIKDRYTRYSAPARGRVVRFHVADGAWLEAGDPIVDIALDDLVAVQERHLELLRQVVPGGEEIAGAATAQSQQADATSDTPAARPVQTAADTRALLQRAGMTDTQIEAVERTGETSPVITLVAGHPGQLLERRVATGDAVEGNAFLFALGGLMRVSVLANAFQRDAGWVKPGQPVEIVLPHAAGEVFKGVVSQGAVSINTNSQNINVKLSFTAPAGQVKSGMYVVGRIYGQVKEDTLVLPRDALIQTRDEQRVIVALGDGRFRPVPVQTGISTDSEVEILAGLEAGESVVVSAQFLIDSESSLQASFRRLGGGADTGR